MAVAAKWRGRGVGAALMGRLMDVAQKQHVSELVLSAQVHAQGFYADFGFAAQGEQYLDADIPHVTMRRALPPISEAPADES